METSREKIKFKPLTDGLGFHKPKEEKQKRVPVGASLAGAPVFFDQKSKIELQAKINTQPAGPQGMPLSPWKPRSIPQQQQPISVQSLQKPAQDPQQTIAQENKPAPTSWTILLKRPLAFAVDLVVCSVTFFIIGAIALLLTQTPMIFNLVIDNIIPVIAATLGFFWATTTAQEILSGTSIGKSFFRIQVSGTAFAKISRALFFIPTLITGFGLFTGLINKKRLCFHDLLSGCEVSEIASL